MGDLFFIFPILFSLVFLFVIGTFVFVIVRNVKTYHKNNNSPRLAVNATIVDKRTHISRTRNSHASFYYVTFEVESGDRMELSVGGSDFGMLIDGDRGRLSFQGTRYLGFERDINN